MLQSRNQIRIETSSSTMSDLVFLLLVFFLITSTLISPNAVKLLLPESGSKTMAKQNVTVYIDENYNFQVGETATDIEGLQPLIAQGIEAGVTDACVVLRADKTVPCSMSSTSSMPSTPSITRPAPSTKSSSQPHQRNKGYRLKVIGY